MSRREHGPVRVLHIVGSMDRGGVETWLMEVFGHVDRSRLAMDVLVHTAAPGAYDDEARRLGVSIIPCAPSSRPARFARRFLRTVRSGRYDVVHSHVHHFSAYPLGLARLAGVPVRIAHSHADTSSVQATAGLVRRIYFATAGRLLDLVATDRLGASVPAGRALFGPRWPDRPRDRLVHYGFDFRRFDAPLDAAAVRRDLGLAPDAFVVGHVGRFDEGKNQTFLLDVVARVARCDPRTVLLLVGEGPLRGDVERQARERGLADRVVFAGTRADVPAVMRAAMDVFVLPSLHEGLGIVGLEAQAAGLPCVLSDAVPREVTVVPELTRFLPLQGAADWVDAVLEARTADRRSRVPELMASSFAVQACLDSLGEVYRRRPGAVARTTVSTDGAPSWRRRRPSTAPGEGTAG
ncbi:glycosyltransferase [Geodermatophilus sp. CPCC 206100]|uniref:glycosyltransferase n=1 Tax=Geodermatophilus sp. CPCC 206100 TaxID=3020054 RepID=UPI003B000BE6